MLRLLNDFYKNNIQFKKKLNEIKHRNLDSTVLDTNQNDLKTINENLVLLYINKEKNKAEFGDTITEEYCEKIIMYGYLTVCESFQ